MYVCLFTEMVLLYSEATYRTRKGLKLFLERVPYTLLGESPMEKNYLPQKFLHIFFLKVILKAEGRMIS